MKIALSAPSGLYVCAELNGDVTANRPEIGSWEVWEVVPSDTLNQIAFRSAHGGYLRAEGGGGGVVTALGTDTSAWQSWTVPSIGWGATTIKARDRGYLGVGPDLRVDAASLTPVLFTVTIVEADPVELPALHVYQKDFVTDDGTRVFIKGATNFLLYKRFLDGEHIDPVLEELRGLGANAVVIFGMVIGFPVGEWAKFRPQAYGDRYYTSLRAFCQKCAQFGQYVYFCVFADTQHIMPALADQLAHFNRVDAELHQESNVLLRLVNEQNAHQNGVDRAKFPNPRTAPACSMDYGEEFGDQRYPPPRWDFGDNHTPRSYPKSVKDMCQSDNPNYLAGEATMVGEPDKFGKDQYTGRTYQMEPRRAREMAGTARGTCAGVVFHNTSGTYAEVMDPDVKACAVAWFAELQGT